MTAIALTIASSDSGGGAGIQADLKTFSALGVYGCSVLAALTAQNTRAVTGIHDVRPAFIRLQIDAVFDDLAVDAVKIGMLSRPETIDAVAEALRALAAAPRRARSGDGGEERATSSCGPRRCGDARAAAAAGDADHAQPARGGSPSRRAAPRPSGARWRAVAARLQGLGARNVLLKGGHLAAGPSPDLLLPGGEHYWLEGERIETRNTHGTGCTLSSAIAAYLARGLPLPTAVAAAKRYVEAAMRAADEVAVGHGHGPVHHFHALWPKLETAS